MRRDAWMEVEIKTGQERMEARWANRSICTTMELGLVRKSIGLALLSSPFLHDQVDPSQRAAA